MKTENPTFFRLQINTQCVEDGFGGGGGFVEYRSVGVVLFCLIDDSRGEGFRWFVVVASPYKI